MKHYYLGETRRTYSKFNVQKGSSQGVPHRGRGGWEGSVIELKQTFMILDRSLIQKSKIDEYNRIKPIKFLLDVERFSFCSELEVVRLSGETSASALCYLSFRHDNFGSRLGKGTPFQYLLNLHFKRSFHVHFGTFPSRFSSSHV